MSPWILILMGSSFPEWRSRQKRPAQSGDLFGSQGSRTQFLGRAEGDGVGLAQGAVDGAGFGHAKFSVIEDERRDVAGVSVAVTDEAAAFGRLEDGGFEDPEILLGAAEGQDGLGVDAGAMVPPCHPKQFGVRDELLCSNQLSLVDRLASCCSHSGVHKDLDGSNILTHPLSIMLISPPMSRVF